MAKNRIKELRNSTNPKITLKQLSNMLKEKGLSFTDSQLSKFENGTSTPRNDEIWIALSEIFDVSLAYLMGISNNQNFQKNNYEIDDEIDDEEYKNLNLVTDFLIFIAEQKLIISDSDINILINLLKSLSLNRNGLVTEKRITELLGTSGKYQLINTMEILRDDEDDDEFDFTGYGYDRDEVYSMLKDIIVLQKK